MESPIETRQPFRLGSKIEIEPGKIIRRELVKNDYGAIILLAFDKDMAIDEHAVPFDVMVQVVEGAVEFSVEGQPHYLSKIDSIILPAMTVHAVKAVEPAKIMLTRIKA
ncbi:MAG: cupin domain-containing protein [Muribaculaceae bacterium]